jgi:cell division septum initiation protein DivIVA
MNMNAKEYAFELYNQCKYFNKWDSEIKKKAISKVKCMQEDEMEKNFFNAEEVYEYLEQVINEIKQIK